MRHTKCIIAAAALLAFPCLTRADQVYAENFDTDQTPFWTFNSSAGSGDLAADNSNNEADYHFDYSTVGIPSADGPGGSTFGLKVEANIPGTGVFEGCSASPTGLTLPDQYILHVKVWQNTIGPMPSGGSGSTQVTNLAVGVSGTSAEFPGTGEGGVQLGVTGDGGSTQDWRLYTGSFPDGAGSTIVPSAHPGTYAAGDAADANGKDPRAAENVYYTTRFPGQSPPAAQAGLFPSQTGTTENGAPAFAWHDWVMVKASDQITVYVDGKLIGTVNSSLFPTFAGNNFALGQADINATSSADSNARSLLFGLFDDVQVESIPEPASMSLLLMGGIALLTQRRRPRPA